MILLVEDHASLRRILLKALLGLGYDVRIASTADEALQLLEEGLLPQLVLTDIRTPGQHNGMDVARWVRSNRPTIPVLLQTGFAQENTADFPILHKPYLAEELSEAIRKLLSP